MNQDPKPPARLWKYRKWNENTKRLIEDGELYFTSLDELNDPFEFYWREQFPQTPDEIEKYAAAFCVKFFPDAKGDELAINFLHITEWIKASTAGALGLIPTSTIFEHGVFCASETYRDLLMWAHYADEHRGVCVSIRTNQLTNRRILPVDYVSEIDVVDAWDYIRENREAFVKVSKRKSPDWYHEREWRTVGRKGPQNFPGVVDYIVVGARATEKTRAEVHELVAKLSDQVQVVDASRNRHEYRLDIPIDD